MVRRKRDHPPIRPAAPTRYRKATALLIVLSYCLLMGVIGQSLAGAVDEGLNMIVSHR